MYNNSKIMILATYKLTGETKAVESCIFNNKKDAIYALNLCFTKIGDNKWDDGHDLIFSYKEV